MKKVSPSDARFLWSYEHSVCFDCETNETWKLKTKTTILHDRYWFATIGGRHATSHCTRKQTAIRALMRAIQKNDNSVEEKSK